MFKYESRVNQYEQLCEREYMESIYQHLCTVMGGEMNDYDFLLWSDTGEGEGCSPICEGDPRKQKVLLYISDETSSVPFHLTCKFSAIFKNYLPWEFPDERIFSLPLGYVSGVPKSECIPVNERKLNVFFSGCPQVSRTGFFGIMAKLASSADHVPVANWDLMQSVAQSEQACVYDMSAAFPESYIRMTPEFAQGLDRSTYGMMLRNCKIALCPPGWKSAETYRHFEAMRAGCIVISGPLPDTRIYRNSPIICLDSWKNLEPTVNKLLKDEMLMLDLQQKTLAWWDNVCSEKAVAEHIRTQLLGACSEESTFDCLPFMQSSLAQRQEPSFLV